MGAHKVIALINNEAYVDLVQGKSIDVAIAPSQITIGTFLSELAGDEVVNKNMTWDVVLPKYIEFYENLLKN